MSTDTERQPKRISSIELLLVVASCIAALAVAIVGLDQERWSNTFAAVAIAAAWMAVLILWAAVRTTLVKLGLLAPALTGPHDEQYERS